MSRFLDAMEVFYTDALVEASRLASEFKEVERGFHAMMEAFGEDPQACGCGEFFGETIAEFLALFAKVRGDVCNMCTALHGRRKGGGYARALRSCEEEEEEA